MNTEAFPFSHMQSILCSGDIPNMQKFLGSKVPEHMLADYETYPDSRMWPAVLKELVSTGGAAVWHDRFFGVLHKHKAPKPVGAILAYPRDASADRICVGRVIPGTAYESNRMFFVVAKWQFVEYVLVPAYHADIPVAFGFLIWGV